MLIFDEDRNSVRVDDGDETRLTKKEGIVMKMLYEGGKSIVSPDDFGEVLYGLHWFEGMKGNTAIEKIMSRLRKKIGKKASKYIKVNRGVGWHFEQQEISYNVMVELSPREMMMLDVFRSMLPEDQTAFLAKRMVWVVPESVEVEVSA